MVWAALSSAVCPKLRGGSGRGGPELRISAELRDAAASLSGAGGRGDGGGPKRRVSAELRDAAAGRPRAALRPEVEAK